MGIGRPRVGKLEMHARTVIATICILIANGCSVNIAQASEEEWVSSSFQLEQLIRQVVKNHPEVLAAKDLVASGDAAASSARWQFFPAPSISSETHSDGSVMRAQLTQPLWSGGRLRADLDVAKTQRASAHWAVVETQHELALRVAEQYRVFSVSAYGTEANGEYIESLEELELMMNRRVARGYSASVDAKLVRSRLSQARNTQTSLLAAKRRAVASLSQLFGADLDGNQIQLPGRNGLDAQVSVADDQFVALAIANNPTLRRLSDDVRVARAQTRQVRSALWPTVFLRAQHSRDDRPGATDDSSGVIVGLEFSLNGGLSIADDIRAARSKEMLAVNSRYASEADIVATVYSDLENFRSARSLAYELAENRTTQSEILNSYRRLFLAGQRTWLDVLNVLRERVEVERSYFEAQVNASVSLYRLKLAIGNVDWSGVSDGMELAALR